MQADDLLTIIKNRRSIRRFLKNPISQEKINLILEAGRWAPSAENSQPWEYLVIKNKEILNDISRTGLGGAILRRAPMAIGVVTKTRPNYAEVEFYKNEIEEVPETGAIGFTPYQDCGLTIMNMLLMIHSLGLGACCVGSIDRDYAKSLLNLKKDDYLAILLAVGNVKKQTINPPPRKDLKEITQYID